MTTDINQWLRNLLLTTNLYKTNWLFKYKEIMFPSKLAMQNLTKSSSLKLIRKVNSEILTEESFSPMARGYLNFRDTALISGIVSVN